MTERERCSNGNYARDKIFDMLTNVIYTNQNLSWKIVWDFEIQTDHQLLTRRLNLLLIKKMKKLLDVPVDHTVKIVYGEKIIKCFDLAREMKKLQNIKATGISITIGALWTVSKGLGKIVEEFKIRGAMETVQPRTVEFWEESWRSEYTCDVKEH